MVADMAFDDISAGELAEAATEIRAAAYLAARLAAAKRLAAGPAASILKSPSALVAVLMLRDRNDPRFELLAAVEQRWSLLVLRLVNEVMRPDSAVADARARGATWAAIGSALGVTASSACHRFGGDA